MNSKPTLQTLPLECFLEILQYVPLPECMFLRSSSSHPKAAVDEHFRTAVRTLPVFLSARHSPGSAVLQDEFYKQRFWAEENSEKICFGSPSGVCQRTIYENKLRYPSVADFRLRGENYLILFDLAKFDAFVAFITKYLPGITTLELIIDHNEHLVNISTVLDLYSEQLKVLLLERTTRCSESDEFSDENNDEDQKYVIDSGGDKKYLSDELLLSMESLDTLEKLYFFSKWTYSINYSYLFDYTQGSYRGKIDSLKKTITKLKVLHLPGIEPIDEYALHLIFLQPNVYVNMEELGIARIPPNTIQSMESSFPKLEKLIAFRELEIEELEPKLMPNLKTLRFCDPERKIRLNETTIGTLNKFPNLERLYCSEIDVYSPKVQNRSIKYIEIAKFELCFLILQFVLDCNEPTLEFIINELKKELKPFTGLEKVIVQMPFIELTGSEIRTINILDS